MTSPRRCDPEPCFHCNATQTHYGIDTMQQCNVCDLFCCESCGDNDADWTGGHWQSWACKECPPGAVTELDRERAEHSRELEQDNDATLGIRQNKRGY